MEYFVGDVKCKILKILKKAELIGLIRLANSFDPTRFDTKASVMLIATSQKKEAAYPYVHICIYSVYTKKKVC